MKLVLKLLGEFIVRNGAGTTLPLPTRKSRALLGYLSVNVNKPQPRDRLMALLWSSFDEKQARHNLNQSLVLIRKLAPAGTTLLDADAERVMLRGDAIETDLARFRSLIEVDPPEAAKLYEGPFLDGLTVPDPAFEEWLNAIRIELHEVGCRNLERAIEAAIADSDKHGAIGFARRLVALDPLRESAHRHMMRLLHDSGDRIGALRQYQACAEILKKQLQIEPDTKTKALGETIRSNASSVIEQRKPATRAQGSGLEDLPLSLPDKPSIAVLPFTNLSADPDQELFADGVVEDVITALSRFRSLFVIARHSSFSYKGTLTDIRNTGRELGVHYVVEGSVRKSSNRVRITAQLIDALKGNHLWADRFDGSYDDIFDLQDKITERIVIAVEPKIAANERERARRKAPGNVDAWTLLQHGLAHFYRTNRNDRDVAIRLFREAIQLDPDFSLAHAYLSFALRTGIVKANADTTELVTAAREAAIRAVSLDADEPMAHFVMGRAHVYDGETKMGIGEMQTAITLNPNFALGHFGLGHVYAYGCAQWENALPYLEMALRLSPRDPLRWLILMLHGSSLRALGRCEEAIAQCREACLLPDCGSMPYLNLAAALAEGGFSAEARAALEIAKKREPALSISYCRNHFYGMHPKEEESLLNSLRKAGLAE